MQKLLQYSDLDGKVVKKYRPMYICQVFVEKAYIKPANILLVHDMTPMMASSNFNRWLNTPTENKVPGKDKYKQIIKKIRYERTLTLKINSENQNE